MPIEEYQRIFDRTERTRQPMHADAPKYDGRMDGMKAHFYTYGDHHEGSKTHIYFHSVDGVDWWPGPNCIAGYFVWDSYVLAPEPPSEEKP